MKSNSKVSSKSKKKSIKNSASNAEILDRNQPPTEIGVDNYVLDKKTKLAENLAINAESSDQDSRSLEDAIVHNDLWMLKYDINENGIGKILLPPSLSILLQSDRVSISPAAGGLFIRSI